MAIAEMITAGAGIVGNLLGGGRSSQSQSSRTNMTDRYNRGSIDVDALFAQLPSRRLLSMSAEDIQSTSMQRAQQDVSGVVDSIFQAYRSDYLPEVFSTSEGAGVYGSSGAQELAERGYSDAVGQAAELTLGTANTYANQRLQEQQSMQQLMNQLLALDVEQTGTSTRRGTEKTTGTGTSPMDFTGITSSLIGAISNNRRNDETPGDRD